MYYLKTKTGTDKVETFRELKLKENQLRDSKINYTIIYPDGGKVHFEIINNKILDY